MKTGKIIVGGLVAVAVWLGYKKASEIKSFYDTFDFSIKAKIHAIKNGMIIIYANVTIDNPTLAHFKMSFPYIKIFNKEKTSIIAKSIIKNEEIDIKPKATALIEKIEIQIPVMTFLTLIASYGPDIIKKLQAVVLTGKMPESFTLGAGFQTQTIFDFDVFRDIVVDKQVDI